MGEEELKRAQTEAASVPAQAVQKSHVKKEKEAALSETLVSEKVAGPATEKKFSGPTDRDGALAKVETDKTFALIKAWEENEKAKAENKAYKKLSAIGSWENARKAHVEAQMKKHEEKMERERAEYGEKIKNKMAEIRKAVEEKKAIIEAKRCEEILKVEETAEKFRATGYTPNRFLGCFSV